MADFSIKDAGVRVGLEIHQQLATGKKLFCRCPSTEEPDGYATEFRRTLRVPKSELGELDPAALFEGAKSRIMLYCADPGSSCLVEQDEEPPHELDCDAKKTALLIASSLNSAIFGEIFPMRKTVIDGSNTAGFQRTMLVAQGGHYEAGGMRIGIQSVCLEEDAAKILGEEGGMKKYGLERLGVPLVEIATEPFEADPREIRDIALALGRILRSTGRVKRGLGSIRQDVNVSIRDGGGVVIEVKGVQQLDQLEKVVEYEAKRQSGLLRISEKLRERNWHHDEQKDRFDLTAAMGGCGSAIIQKALDGGHRICGIAFGDMGGMFGFSPYDGVRLGRDVAELAKTFGIGGVFHSDELPNYGVGDADVQKVRRLMGIADGKGDAFVMFAAPQEMVGAIAGQIVRRINLVKSSGIPADTRMATQSGETKFLRPRPGSARMYPETDIPPITVSARDLEAARDGIPKPWDEVIRDMQNKYGLNAQLTGQVLDSEYAELFEDVCGTTGVSPNFVASTLCSTVTNLERRGLDRTGLTGQVILRIFGMLSDQKISKESVEMILEGIMAGRPADVVIKESSAGALSDVELDGILDRIVGENRHLVEKQGERSSGPLMGIAMKTLRGKTSGEKISSMLREKILKALNNNNNNNNDKKN